MTVHDTPVDLGSIGRSSSSPPISWTSTDGLLYALGVGASADPERDELTFTTETSGSAQDVLPTYAVLIAARAQEAAEPIPLGSFGLERVLHGEQSFELHGRLPAEGVAVGTTTVEGIHDLGSHAAIVSRTHVVLSTGEALLTTRSTIIVRGAGGFGSPTTERLPWPKPHGAPDDVVVLDTQPHQALLYRLSGDRNPLHSDPRAARAAGFDRPILHGMCTYGFAGRALLHSPAAAGGDVDVFGGMSARFSTPVFPGARLTTHIWRTEAGATFRTLVDDQIVLDHGLMVRSRP